MGTSKLLGKPNETSWGSNLQWTSFPSRRSSNTPSRFMLPVWDNLRRCRPHGSCADFILFTLNYCEIRFLRGKHDHIVVQVLNNAIWQVNINKVSKCHLLGGSYYSHIILFYLLIIYNLFTYKAEFLHLLDVEYLMPINRNWPSLIYTFGESNSDLHVNVLGKTFWVIRY